MGGSTRRPVSRAGTGLCACIVTDAPAECCSLRVQCPLRLRAIQLCLFLRFEHGEGREWRESGRTPRVGREVRPEHPHVGVAELCPLHAVGCGLETVQTTHDNKRRVSSSIAGECSCAPRGRETRPLQRPKPRQPWAEEATEAH